eukprot:8094219-Ditylum_brightwellii.AAC.1
MTENDMLVNNIKIEGADGSQTKLKHFPPEEDIRMLRNRTKKPQKKNNKDCMCNLSMPTTTT